MVYIKNTEINIENILNESKDKFGVHWGTVSNKKRTINQSIAIILRSYTRAINGQENRNGSLFQQSTKSICLTDNSEIAPSWFQTSFGAIINIPDPELSYPQTCFNYIHQNPVNAFLVKRPKCWEFSSWQDYVGMRNGKLICRERALEFGLTI